MNDPIVYRPYKEAGCLIPVMALLGIFACTTAAFSLDEPDISTFLLFLPGAVGMFAAKALYDCSRIVLSFESEGLRIMGERKMKERFLPWEEYRHAVRTLTGKGDWYVVLSSEELDSKKSRKAYGSRLFLNENMDRHCRCDPHECCPMDERISHPSCGSCCVGEGLRDLSGGSYEVDVSALCFFFRL